MSLDAFILTFTCAVNLSLGLFIFLRNPKILSSLSFFALTVSISAWAVTNYLTEDTTVSLSVNALCNRLAYLFGLWAFVSITVFSYNFPLRTIVSRGRVRAFIALVAIISALSLTDLVAGHVTKDMKGLHFSIGPLSSVYALVLMLLLGAGARRLLKNRKTSASQVRSQINLVLIGFCVSATLGVIMNVALPSIIENFETAKFGPLLTVFLMGMTTYAIVKHRLFDIRLVVARSLAYVLSLVTMGMLFALGTYAFSSAFLRSNDLNSSGVKWVYTLLAIALALIFPPLKRFFDRNTSKLFYRDTYDTQSFLDDFNKVLVATYELTPLLRKSAAIIKDNLKPTYTVFGLKETESAPRRIMGTTGHPDFSEEDIDFVRDITPKMRRKLIVTDLLEEKYSDLQKTLQANNISVIARLTSSSNEEGIGYLVLGPKKSGNLYSSQDLKNIEIVANELVIAIQNALRFEEIENFNLTLQAKVDEATRNLRKANERLKELDETKDDFISMASHQLRTPLTSVKGYISMVLEGDAGKLNETQKKLLEQSFFSSQRMVYLISDLLNVSRLKTGKFIIEPAPVNLADMVEQEMDQLKETAAAKGLTLTYEKPKDFPTLMLDETKIRQVVMNFADNAIYYTPAGGHIRVELNETPASVELRVVDDGIGVPKTEQHHLFTKFYRAGNARKARPDGTGLGLFMAKKVIVAQGGALIFESTEGKGSTFGFVFNKAKLPATSVNKPAAAKMLMPIAK